MSQPVLLLIAFVVGYLFGAIPFGLIFTRLAGTQDLRSIGSGNIGATNVLRTGRRELAAATLVCDALKGTAAVWLARYIGGTETAAMVAAIGAFLGHLFPVWLGFKGGKGVATYIGLLIGLFWPAAIAFCVLWLIVAVVTRYSSASALIASIAAGTASVNSQGSGWSTEMVSPSGRYIPSSTSLRFWLECQP
jgi:glycerol-3-phosphate acyltransferase PlsY